MFAMRWLGTAAVLVVASVGLAAQQSAAQQSTAAPDPAPRTIDEFIAAARRVIDEAGVPGAGIALVRADGIEWAGGLGFADRDTKRPVDADTHFRVGSISKTFVALALVQLYEDGKLDLEATVSSLLPDVSIENPWEHTDPVRVRHVLEHTAGFDDMHFNETYVLDGAADLPLDAVLRRNPASRRVRWRPGTRMAYSNPGYAVAGRIVEVVSDTPFEQYVSEKILRPLAMTTTAFPVRPDDDPALARGYDAPAGRAVINRPIYLRPAGALQSSARELGRFVQMLLNWGELGEGYVVDPEYLSNMEWPRTTAAATAGVRSGYGLGIFSTIDRPFDVLGHDGGIDGYAAAYGYSPARDVGYVVLLNGTYAPDAMRRLATLAMRYLKRDVDPPPAEQTVVPVEALHRFEGYYQDANPRQALMRIVEIPLGGYSVRVDGDRLTLTHVLGAPERLVAVNDALFRRDVESTASMVFTTVDGRAVLAGNGLYAERRARWPYDLLRVGLGSALSLAVLAPIAALVRGAMGRRRGWGRARGLGLAWTVLALALASGVWLAATASLDELAVPSSRSWIVYGCSLLYPLLAFALLPLTALALTRGIGRRFAWLAGAVASAHVGLAAYLAWWGLIAFRSWTY